MKKFLFLLIGIFLLSFRIVSSVDIGDCGLLNLDDTVYILTKPIEDVPVSTCMHITGRGVTLDCNNFKIDGVDRTDTSGISVDGTHITIKNCIISDWSTGISLSSKSSYNYVLNNTIFSNADGISIRGDYIRGGYNVIKDNKIESSTNEGIDVYGANENQIIDNEIKSNRIGIWVTYYSKSNEIIGNKIVSNGLGIGLAGVYDNLIKDNLIEDSDSGIELLWGASGNMIFNNFFKNTNNLGFEQFYKKENYWNTTMQYGKRVCRGPGKIGGNYWSDYDTPEEGCTDQDDDCFCDKPYVIAENNKDYLPLTYWCECPDRGCYTNETGEYAVSNKDLTGNYTCDTCEDKRCKYSKIQKCPTHAEDSDIHLFGGIFVRGDLKVQGYCIDYTGCNNGECTQNPPKNDYCTERLPDLNRDGVINILDIAIVARAFGSKPGDPKWNPDADVKKDDTINIVDIAIVARVFGKIVTENPGLLVEYYNTSDGHCDVWKYGKEPINCSKVFNRGPLEGAEWSCSEGRCVGCQSDEECWKLKGIENSEFGTGKECVVYDCKDKCNLLGYLREWYCNKTSGYCEYTTGEECVAKVAKNKICLGGIEVNASEDYSCRADNKPVPYCPARSCSGHWHYAECNGKGECDLEAREFFEEAEVRAEEGYVLNERCESVEGFCRLEATCKDACSLRGTFYACDKAGECNYLLQETTSSCNGATCENDKCTDKCSKACGADRECDEKKIGECGNNEGICNSHCKYYDCGMETDCIFTGCLDDNTRSGSFVDYWCSFGQCQSGERSCSRACPTGQCCLNAGCVESGTCYGKLICSSGKWREHCGDGSCNCGETYSSCPKDCCDSDGTATYDNVCHVDCNSIPECNNKASGTVVCNGKQSATCCIDTFKCDDQYCGAACDQDVQQVGGNPYYCQKCSNNVNCNWINQNDGKKCGDTDHCDGKKGCDGYACSSGSCNQPYGCSCSLGMILNCGAECVSDSDCENIFPGTICNLENCMCQ